MKNEAHFQTEAIVLKYISVYKWRSKPKRVLNILIEMIFEFK